MALYFAVGHAAEFVNVNHVSRSASRGAATPVVLVEHQQRALGAASVHGAEVSDGAKEGNKNVHQAQLSTSAS